MDSDPLGEHGRWLSERLREERRQSSPHRWQCSPELRAELVAYAVACRADGESHQRVAERLGLIQPTLSRWIRKARAATPGLRQLAIVPSARRRDAPPAPAGLRLVSPNGFTVEGLDLHHVADLLRILG